MYTPIYLIKKILVSLFATFVGEKNKSTVNKKKERTMKFTLPTSIWSLIFCYDNTYHEKYKNYVLEEFKTISSQGWKVVWIHSDRKTEYGVSKDWAETVCEYWNETYATYYDYDSSENPQQCYMALNTLGPPQAKEMKLKNHRRRTKLSRQEKRQEK